MTQEEWERDDPVVEVDESWLRTRMPSLDFKALVPLAGGLRNSVFRVVGTPFVLRMYKEGPTRFVEQALEKELKNPLIPAFFLVHPTEPWALIEHRQGTRLADCLKTLSPKAARRAGESAAEFLQQMPSAPHSGIFTGTKLQVEPVWKSPEAMWAHFTTQSLVDVRVREVLGERFDAVCRLVKQGEQTLGGRPVVCHGDFKPENLLVDPNSGELLAVLDWEFVHAGLPVFDVGQLIRWGPQPFQDGVDDVMGLGDWRRDGELCDLTNQLGFLTRQGPNIRRAALSRIDVMLAGFGQKI